MIAILISVVLCQVEDFPPLTPVQSYKFGYMSYDKYHESMIKHVMADRAKFYKAVAAGQVKIDESDLSLVRGLVRRDLQETEIVIKSPDTPRNLKSLAKVHFRVACDAMSTLEKQNPGSEPGK